MRDLSNENIIHVKRDGIEYLQFRKLLNYPEITHAYVIGLDKSFRLFRGETPEQVQKNELAEKSFKKICNELNLDYNNIVTAEQRHTDNVEIVNEKRNTNKYFELYKKTDGLITNKKNIILSTINADCILLIFYDPIKKVIANVHSGWRGTLQKISINAVEKMHKEYGCNPKDLICCMAPSIGKDHFEVDKDVYEMFYNEFKELDNINDIIEQKGNKWHIDTILINRTILKSVGLKEENIIDSGICSVCNKDLIHSYRAHGEKAGRCGQIVANI